MATLLRGNSRLRARLGTSGYQFLCHAAGAVERILPHVEVSGWREVGLAEAGAFWTSQERTSIRIAISVGTADTNGRSIVANVQRKHVPVGPGTPDRRILDTREHDICRRIAWEISAVVGFDDTEVNVASLEAIGASFDELIVAEHLEEHHGLNLSLRSVFASLHKLAEQTYENKSLTFGCIFDKTAKSKSSLHFPKDFLEIKKYRALSDGYRTAYHLSSTGQVVDFLDLETLRAPALTGKHFYPSWAKSMARVSRANRCGIALSRQGDLLVFDEGSLRFTYRYGRWQYWNHVHLTLLLRDRARAQHVRPTVLGKLIGQVYRAALDVSFRRSGALFVILRNQHNIHRIVRRGDAMYHPKRLAADREFDNALRYKSIAGAVAVELAALDGAVVLDNSGSLVAFGAVLKPKKSGRVNKAEGSRTKAAIGASFYGLAIKISSDGDITVYHQGQEFIRI